MSQMHRHGDRECRKAWACRNYINCVDALAAEAVASHCVLIYQHPLSELAKERLSVMRATTDGFKIAQRDLELRGPGEILGTRQTGDLSFRVADLLRDSDLLPAVHKAAELVMRETAEIIEPLSKRWLSGEKDYGKV